MSERHLESTEPDGEATDETPPGEKERSIIVRVGDDIYAIRASEVLEILTPRPTTRIPGAPAAVVGLVNHRGEVVTVVDLGRSLGRSRLAAKDHRLVIVRNGPDLVGLVISDVIGFAHPHDGSGTEGPARLDLDVVLDSVF